MAVFAQVMPILRRLFVIHVACIPVALARHCLRPPVGPDAEFGVTEPVRCTKTLQRRGIGVERAWLQRGHICLAADCRQVACQEAGEYSTSNDFDCHRIVSRLLSGSRTSGEHGLGRPVFFGGTASAVDASALVKAHTLIACNM